MNDTAFATCIYLRSRFSFRARIVSKCLKSWQELLSDNFFKERILLDDRSPGCNGLRLATRCGLLPWFTQAVYETHSHPAHSNFGIVGCMERADADYIVHFDDDVLVNDTEHALSNIRNCVEVLRRDDKILGINLLYGASGDWGSGAAYVLDDRFAHPARFFGTAACVIRRELLKEVGMSQIRSWGSQQPDVWELIVSKGRADRFLVSCTSDPGVDIPQEAWLFPASGRGSIVQRLRQIAARIHRTYSRNG